MPSHAERVEHPPPLMTRQQLMNPFDSDEEEEPKSDRSRSRAVSEAPRKVASAPRVAVPRETRSEGPLTRVIDLSPTRDVPRIPRDAASLPDGFPLIDPRKRPNSRLAELQERARQLLEDARKPQKDEKEDKSSEQERKHQEQLRARARLMIAQARQGSARPTNDTLNNNNNANCRHLSPDLRPSAGMEDGQKEGDADASGQPCEVGSPPALLPRTPSTGDVPQARRRQTYVEMELEALERERQRVDAQAERFEPYLRRVMKSGNQAEEDRCMQRWFALVNEKNALIRRQMQLNLLEKEQDLERRFEMLNRELRDALTLQDWQKTDAQRKREDLLLEELVALVDKRDELVQHLDSQEKAIEEDEMMALATRRQKLQPAQERPNCRLQ